MNKEYEDFSIAVKEALENKLGDGFVIDFQILTKLNDVQLHSLTIKEEKNSIIAPVIYLEQYYEDYKNGICISNIVDTIFDLCNSEETKFMQRNELADVYKSFTDFDNVKDKLLFKLVNFELNKEYLKGKAFVQFMDLAAIFYILVNKDEEGFQSAMVTNAMIDNWAISKDELFLLARNNNKLLTPPVITDMKTMITEILKAEAERDGLPVPEDFLDLMFPPENSMPMYVVTNKNKINGACNMVYLDIFKELSDKMQSDVCVLPSSVHEFIVVPVSDSINTKELVKMVKEINGTEVPVSDILSYNVYKYVKDTNSLTMVSIEKD